MLGTSGPRQKTDRPLPPKNGVKAIDTIGTQVFHYLNENVQNGTPIITQDTVGITPPSGIQKLNFNLDSEMYSEISKNMNEYEKVTNKFYVDVLELGDNPSFTNQFWVNPEAEELKKIDIGRNWMKKYKIPTDAFQQIGIQIAAALIRGKIRYLPHLN